MTENIKLRCLEISADANKNNPENILIDAKQMFDFTQDTPFDTSFLIKLLRISAPDERLEEEDLVKVIGRKVLDYVNKEKARIRAQVERQPGYYSS
ncbi:hypothetical protein [Flavobacterium sp. W20_MBD1_R3]|uniref:hypothetical protein n=1 Tax=Flavobacterium sp. W20_MBD1_R3 TaxID=3240278 RepID=UPI003F934F83